MMFNDKEMAVGRLVQRDLPMTQQPYHEIATRTGLSEPDVIAVLSSLMARGVIRKFGAILRHRKAGFTRNAMVVWAVPAERCEKVGEALSSIPEITHCYERSPAFLGRYNLFTMIHLRGRKEKNVIGKIAEAVGVADYRILLSEREFKKSSMEYFA